MTLTTTLKRTVRIAIAALPFRTKIQLLRAEFNWRNADRIVTIGSTDLCFRGDTQRIDYFTLFGALLDRHFDDDVRGAAVLDVGAHKGFYAARALDDGAASVRSYEPASQNYDALESAASNNPNWITTRAAVGAEEGSITLHLSPGSWGHSVHTPLGGVSTGTEVVPLLSLSTELRTASEDATKVVVKINVEGAAGDMILGTGPRDWAKVASVWVDVEPNDPVGFTALADHLEAAGLHHRAVENNRNHFSRTATSGRRPR